MRPESLAAVCYVRSVKFFLISILCFASLAHCEKTVGTTVNQLLNSTNRSKNFNEVQNLITGEDSTADSQPNNIESKITSKEATEKFSAGNTEINGHLRQRRELSQDDIVPMFLTQSNTVKNIDKFSPISIKALSERQKNQKVLEEEYVTSSGNSKFPKGQTSFQPDHQSADCISEKYNIVVSAIKCDFEQDGICWVNRGIGDTLTFNLNVNSNDLLEKFFTIRWYKTFGFSNAFPPSGPRSMEIKTGTSWNLFVGSGGLELRISPVTDIDVDHNGFLAKVFCETNGISRMLKEIRFHINVLPIELLRHQMEFRSPQDETVGKHWTFEEAFEQEGTPFLSSRNRKRSFDEVTDESSKRRKVWDITRHFDADQFGDWNNELMGGHNSLPLLVNSEYFPEKNSDTDSNHLEIEDARSVGRETKGICGGNYCDGLGDVIPVEIHYVQPTIVLIMHENGGRKLDNRRGTHSNCTTKHECGPRAICVFNDNQKGVGHCQCKSEYKGDGFWCRRIEGSRRDKRIKRSIQQQTTYRHGGINSFFNKGNKDYIKKTMIENYNDPKPSLSNTEMDHCKCINSKECSLHAICTKDGSCHCKDGYEGNGIFCWKIT